MYLNSKSFKLNYNKKLKHKFQSNVYFAIIIFEKAFIKQEGHNKFQWKVKLPQPSGDHMAG